ncbi:flavodoxin domain-containing protein [Marinomonas sp. 5E14-1]|uniref:flavodoxin domain-containing protein n=1 Tax=Marinomonas sp. 5E14-1 TaxID=3153922 RepID=UPI0032668A7A
MMSREKTTYALIWLITKLVYVLLIAEIFTTLYIIGAVTFSKPISGVVQGAELITKTAPFLLYQLHYSMDFGYAILEGQTVLYMLSYLELGLFNMMTVFVPTLVGGGIICLLGLTFLGVNKRYLLVILIVFFLCMMAPSWQILEKGITSVEYEVLRLCVVSIMLWLTSGRFSYLRPSHKGGRSNGTLLAYASQTGSARQLAFQLKEMANSLLDVQCVSTLTMKQLRGYARVYFVVSTYGKGESPDCAHKFIIDLQRQETSLDTIYPSFSVLALGDRSYTTFCQFGHTLSSLLERIGFRRELPVHEVDRMDLASIESWWRQISEFMGIEKFSIKMPTIKFNVSMNQNVNPQRTERAAHHIRLNTLEKLDYKAGDLIAVCPKLSISEIEKRLIQRGWSNSHLVELNSKSMALLDALLQLDWHGEVATSPQALVDLLSPVHERLYSIASYGKNYVDVLVRKHYREDGSIGNGSGYLCGLLEGDQVEAQIRTHESFQLSDDSPLIMIGAGTGIAPFRAFLQQKEAWKSQSEHWLIFGEQYRQHDDYFCADFERFQEVGLLTRIDKAWSRSGQMYVQDILEKEADRLYEWMIHKGAHIYVCGSRIGFGEQVLVCLTKLLGEDVAERLHTDLY